MIRDQIIQELDQMPESQLKQVLELVRSLKSEFPSSLEDRDAWQAYLVSEQEREEVYRRLANS
jgi:hypothetical protein